MSNRKPLYVTAETAPGAWKLPDNPVWSIPEGHELRGEFETFGPWGIISRYRALAIDLSGRVYGLRTMYAPKEAGYNLEGRVSIGGRKVRAFTSGKLFERPDGSLCSVAVLVVCTTDADSLATERAESTAC